MLPTKDSSRRRFAEYNAKRRAASPKVGAESGKKPKPARPFGALLSEFWRLVGEGGHRRAVLFALFTLTITSGITLVVPASTKLAIDYVISETPGPLALPAWAKGTLDITAPATGAIRFRLLWYLGGAMVVLSALAVLVGMLGRWQMTRVTKRMQVELRRKAFDHAVQLPLHRVQHYKSGGMASLLREDAGLVGELLFSMIYNPWRAIVTLLGTLCVLAYTDWRFLLGGLLCIPAVWVTHKTWISRIRPLYRDAKQVRQNIDATTTEAFGGLRVVRGFARQRAESTRFVTAQHLMTRIEILTWWWSRIVDIAWSILIPLASAAVLVYGGSQIIKGSLTIGDLMMFTTYLLMLLGPLETLTHTATNIQTNLAAFDRVLALLDEPEEYAGQRDGFVVSRANTRGNIAIDGVWFQYPLPEGGGQGVGSIRAETSPTRQVSTRAHVLEDITLHVRAGETIALVGPSGSGKTTLCNLVARFYDPTRGTVSLDGRNLRDIDFASFRTLLGIVEQDVFLFDGTIAENIAYARADATESEITGAARAANAHDFITHQEKGYQTLIGERGVRLSGGQKQRIAIARAVLADPLILILDEATSNLDTESEHLIQQSLAGLMKGRTCFVIAHRLSTVRNADRIVVLEKGRIVESGSHDDLMQGRGMYAHLVSLQMEGHAKTEHHANPGGSGHSNGASRHPGDGVR
jgi:ATP-binding cassette subfamily B protein/subfamily B ATP-binding cassette protein MsbA